MLWKQPERKDHMLTSDFQIVELLGKGKSGHSYLALHAENRVVVKKMHQEEVTYYTFSKPKVTLELESYHLLKKAAIPIPELLGFNHEEQFIVKQFIEGQTVSETLKTRSLPENLLFRMLEWEEQLRSENINIDYFPTNFVLHDNDIYYVDYEHNPYTDAYNFRNWGIYYWLNREGFAAFLETGDSNYINISGTGKPIVTETLTKQRNHIIALFNSGKENRHKPTTS